MSILHLTLRSHEKLGSPRRLSLRNFSAEAALPPFASATDDEFLSFFWFCFVFGRDSPAEDFFFVDDCCFRCSICDAQSFADVLASSPSDFRSDRRLGISIQIGLPFSSFFPNQTISFLVLANWIYWFARQGTGEGRGIETIVCNDRSLIFFIPPSIVAFPRHVWLLCVYVTELSLFQ